MGYETMSEFKGGFRGLILSLRMDLPLIKVGKPVGGTGTVVCVYMCVELGLTLRSYQTPRGRCGVGSWM